MGITLVPDWTLVFQLAIFLVVIAVLTKFIFKPILKIIDQRRYFTKHSIETADRLNQYSISLENEYKEKINKAVAKASNDATLRISSCRTSAEDAVSAAKKQASVMIQTTEQELDSKVEGLAQETKKVLKNLSGEIVTKILQ